MSIFLCYHKTSILNCSYNLPFLGNPWPPVVPKVTERKGLLTNILLDAARKDYQRLKKEGQGHEDLLPERQRPRDKTHRSVQELKNQIEELKLYKDVRHKDKTIPDDGTPV